MKVRRVERSGGAIIRCRDCRLLRAGKPRAGKSGEMDVVRSFKDRLEREKRHTRR